MAAYLLDHLWQSTLVALSAALLTLAFRTASASVRHGLWLAASMKFLIPFAALAALAKSTLGKVLAPSIHATPQTLFIQKAAQPFSQTSLAKVPFIQGPITQTLLSTAHAETAVRTATQAAPHVDPLLILLVIWGLGTAMVLIAWTVRWVRVRRIVRQASRLAWPAPMPVLASPSLLEPGLIGLWRPVLVLPETLPDHLNQVEIAAIVAHEAAHLRRRDNLTAAAHMLVEALFWFHPLVWWIGDRLIAERERACDEAVVQAGHDRATYARSLVESCRLYLQSPLDCVAGASGSNLKTRVETIMTAPPSSPLSPFKKALLLAAGVCALASPVTAALLTSPDGQKAVARAADIAARAMPTHTDTARPTLQAPSPAITTMSVPDERGTDASIVLAANTAAPTAPSIMALGASAATDTLPTDVAALGGSTLLPSVTVESMAKPKTIEQQSWHFTGDFASTPNPEIDQIARWRDPVCVRVAGLGPAQEGAIKARIEDVAKGVGLKLGKTGCTADVEVLFTDKPQAVMDTVAKRREEVLGYYHRHERDKLKTVTHPIQAWYITATAAGAPLISGDTARSESIDDPDNHAPGGCGDSAHFTVCDQSVFVNILVVADTKVLQGKDAGLLSDYLAMLTLAQPRALDACKTLPSVTDLFAKSACPGRDTPNGLTPADAAYLTALYQTDPEAKKPWQQGDIARRMASLLIKNQAVAR